MPLIPYKMYGDIIYNIKTLGLFEPLKKIPMDSVSCTYSRIDSSNYCTLMFQVREFGQLIDSELFYRFKRLVRSRYKSKVYFCCYASSKHYKIKWSSTKMKDNRKRWIRGRKNAKQQKSEDDNEVYSVMSADEEWSLEERRGYSWQKFQNSDKEDIACNIYSLVFSVRIPKKDYKQISDLLKAVKDTATQLSLTLSHLNFCTDDYLNTISPFKHTMEGLGSKLIAERAETADITTQFISVDQNHLPEKRLKLGLDYSNNQLVSIDPLEGLEGGSSMFVYGDTGSGKSVNVKNMCEEMLASGLFLYLCDYEKNEYKPLGDAYNATYINLGAGDGCYYEPLMLGNLTGIDSIDKQIFSDALDSFYSYVTLFKGSALSANERVLLMEQVNFVITCMGADSTDPNTWDKLGKLTMRDIYYSLERLSYSESYMKKYGKELTNLVSCMKIYLDPTSPKSVLLSNPISIEELKDVRFLIYKFSGDGTGSLVEGSDISLQLQQLTKMVIDKELARVRRSRNEAFCSIYEEVQRYVKGPGAAESLNAAYTGIRKNNGFVVSVLNDGKLLVNELSHLLTNSRYVIIGKVNSMDNLDALFNTPQLANAERHVKLLPNYKHGFYIKTPEFESIYRVVLPKELLDSPLYKTVDVDSSKVLNV